MITRAELLRNGISTYNGFNFNRLDAQLLRDHYYCEEVILASDISNARSLYGKNVEDLLSRDLQKSLLI